MGIEEETVSHTLCHLNETAERDGETQLISSDPRTYRWVEKSDETTMALFLILYHCHGNHCAASRPEQRHHGIGLVGVVESPSAQARQHIGCGKEQHSFRLRKRRCLVYPEEVEIWFLCPLHSKSLDVVGHHLRSLLVFLLQRHKGRHPLWHIGKTSIEFSTATADNIHAETDRCPLSGCLQALEKTTAYLFCFCHWLVTVSKQQRQWCLNAKRLLIIADKLLYLHMFLGYVVMSAKIVNSIELSK